MAEIRPFRALQYDTRRIPIQEVVTQPYDKITPSMRERYLAAHPNNLVRVLRPLDDTGIPEGVSPYQNAARVWCDWRREGIVRRADEPALFAYYQRFSVPGAGQVLTRKAFVGLTRLEDYANGVIFPHERTLAGPREDRLELLRHTRTHFGQVFLLYSDPERRAERAIEAEIAGEAPLSLRDEDDVEHMLWKVSRPQAIAGVCRLMSEGKLLIADGHHRYETALAFRDEERRRSGDAGPFEWLMTTLVNMESPGLLVLPTHRVLGDLPSFDAARLLAQAAEFYEVRDVPDAGTLVRVLSEQPASRPALGLVVPGAGKLLVLGEGLDPAALVPGVSPRYAALDVVLLHRLILGRCLGLSEEAVRQERHIRYLRDAAAAAADVEEGRAQACFLLRGTPLADVRDIAFGGGVLPQKSTDFFPKLLSGLVMYAED